MDIKLYSTNCPKCQILEKKLQQAGKTFEIITDFDVKFLRDKGFMSAPVLQVGEDFMNFTTANTWINGNKNQEETCDSCKF